MPFTPLHLGLGTVAKAIAPQHFSLLLFSGIQVLMDLEPLFAMIFAWDYLHFYTHNLIGAFLIGSIGILLGKPITALFLRLYQTNQPTITWSTAILTGYFASFSHILLDAFMHSDMFAFFPISKDQSLLNLFSYTQLESFCVLALLMGGSICAYRHIKRV